MHSDEEQAPRGGEEQQGEDERHQAPSRGEQQQQRDSPQGSQTASRRVTPAGASSNVSRPSDRKGGADNTSSDDDSTHGKRTTKSPQANKRSAAAQLSAKSKSKTKNETRSKSKAVSTKKQTKASAPKPQSPVVTRLKTKDKRAHQTSVANAQPNESLVGSSTAAGTSGNGDSENEANEEALYKIPRKSKSSRPTQREKDSTSELTPASEAAAISFAGQKRTDGHQTTLESFSNSSNIQKLREQFVELRQDLYVDAETSAHKPAEIRYLERADNPLPEFLSVIRTAKITSDGGIEKSPPTVKLVQGTGVAWKGQPVLPSEPTGFPIERICSISSLHGDPNNIQDEDIFTEFVNEGRCPIVCTFANSIDAAVSQSWLTKDSKRKDGSILHVMDEGSFYLAYKGPRVGTEADGRPSIPFLQSIAIAADKFKEQPKPDQQNHLLRLDGDVAERDAWRIDRDATFIELKSDKKAENLWLLAASLPLPKGHGIPYDTEISCDGLSLDSFIRKIAKNAREPIESFDWLRDQPTEAWFKAANADESGHRMATNVIAMQSPPIRDWLKPYLEGSAEADMEAHKLWIHPLLSVIHQMYQTWWLNSSSPNPNMITKYKRFVDSALTEYVTDPAPLGRPSLPGATFLLTLYNPDVKSWRDQFSLSMFRSKIFLAPYIANYSGSIRTIPSTQRPASDSNPQPLLSPHEKASMNQDDDAEDSDASPVDSISSSVRFRAFFNSGREQPTASKGKQKSTKQKETKRKRLFDDDKHDSSSDGSEEDQRAEQEERQQLSKHRRKTKHKYEQNKPPLRSIATLSPIKEKGRKKRDRDSTDSSSEDEEYAELPDKKRFAALPKLDKVAVVHKVGVPKPNRVYPGDWRTPAISQALELSGQDYFDAREVVKADDVLRYALRPSASVKSTWHGSTKESTEDSKKQTLAPGAFDVKKFIQQTMLPLQRYTLFACATRPANPDKWEIVTRVDSDIDPCTAQYAINGEDLIFPGYMSPKAGLEWLDTRIGKATPQSAIAALMRTAKQNTQLQRGPVRACFVESFQKAVGRVHLFNHLYVPIEQVENAENCWSAFHWMQSAYDHQSNGQPHLRLPTGGYTAKAIRDTTRNIWWFHNLLTESGDAFKSSADGRTNFSSNGLLSDKLLYLSRWIKAESPLDSMWNEDLTPEKREKISAHFCVRLSDLLDIFQRWMDFHPTSEPTRCVLFQNESLSREDLFVLESDTRTKQGKHDSVCVDLRSWQEDFEHDFSEAHLQTTALDWPPLFPQVLKPQSQAKQHPAPDDGNKRNPVKQGGDRNNDPNQGNNNRKQQQQKQPANRQNIEVGEGKQIRPGEYLIADIPALRLKQDYKQEIGADFNIGLKIKEARAANPGFPDPPAVNQKTFCFRFMTAKCGCRTAHSTHRHKQGVYPCNRIHLDLAKKGEANSIPREAFEQLIAYVQTAPLSELVEPTVELLAMAQARR